jgi:secondary thiamine-phosphate synthase enzyme
LRQASHQLHVSTRGKGLYEVTSQIENWVAQSGIRNGLLTLFVRHTSASLTIQENADPDVRDDLNAFFERLAPERDPLYSHTTEGPDDMPAHVRSALTQTSVSIPVLDGSPALGTWQGVYVFEHRRSPNRRTVLLHLMGE